VLSVRQVTHRPFALIQTLDQWRRCAHDQTALDPLTGAVELARRAGPCVEAAVTGPLPELAGLVFDRHCRLYRAAPEQGQVFVHRWSERGADLRAELDPVPEDREGRPLFELPAAEPLGEFISVGACPGPLRRPTGLAIDGLERLYVWEAEPGGLLVWDLERAVVRQRLVLGYAGAVDLAWIGERLVGVGPELPGVLERGYDGHLRLRPYPSGFTGVPARVAGDSRGRIHVLVDAGTSDARVMALDHAREPIAVPGASDLVFLSARDHAEGERVEVLVVARGPGQSLRVFVLEPGALSEDDSLAARGYDGRGIARTPDDRVAYFGARGLRHAVDAAPRYPEVGHVVGFRLDAGEFQARWGRIFIDACVPRGTELRVATYVTDDPLTDEIADLPIARTPPVNAGSFTLKQPDEPPMPPASQVPAAIDGRLVERGTGRELPWTIRDEHERRRFSTWESVVQASATEGGESVLGRYLWVFLELRGNGRRTPRVRSLRVERSGHTLPSHLPGVYSRDAVAAEFLWRFLAPFDGALTELELRTILRHALLDPRSSPAPFLPWLADMLGLVLDRRWPLAARRRVIAEANWLFRFRGTVPGLRRWLELYLGEGRVEILEHFRVRGLGGALVGDEGPTASSSILGAGFRVGGAIGREQLVDLDREQSFAELGADGFASHAHRFTVLVLASLVGEEREVVELILEQHRPAHTLYELCTVDAGLRVGLGLHVGLSSMIGAGSGWTRLQLGASTLGRHGLIDRPRSGTSLGGARVGKDSRVG
jgi:phage tail-like protein